MLTANTKIDNNLVVGKVEPRMFGTLVEQCCR